LNGRGRNGEKHWNLYVEPFVVHKGDRVAVQAFRVGYKKSEIVDFLIEH
jgi:dUTPase